MRPNLQSLHPVIGPPLNLSKGALALGDELRRQIRLARPDGTVEKIRTIKEALRWVEFHTDAHDPRWQRAAKALKAAKADGSLRELRAATRAFEEALRQPGKTYGTVDGKRI